MYLAIKTILLPLVMLLLNISNVIGDEVESELKYIELSTDTWEFSLPESWKPVAIEGGIRIDSHDEVFAIYLATYLTESGLIGWAQRDIKMVKESKYSAPDNDFEFISENVDLKNEIQSFVLDGYDKKSNFRIYTKHFRIGNKLVTLSIHDHWCQSYEESLKFTDELLNGFKIKT
jgi:hypothetical protein